MYCSECGKQNADESRFCYACGAKLAGAGQPESAANEDAASQAPSSEFHDETPKQDAPTDYGYNAPQPPYPNAAPPPPPGIQYQQFQSFGIPDFMTHGVFITIFSLMCCCALNFMFPVVLILGIIIMVNASKIRSLTLGGNVQAALNVSNTNRTLVIAALIAFCVGVAMFAASSLMGGLTGLLSGMGAMDGLNWQWTP